MAYLNFVKKEIVNFVFSQREDAWGESGTQDCEAHHRNSEEPISEALQKCSNIKVTLLRMYLNPINTCQGIQFYIMRKNRFRSHLNRRAKITITFKATSKVEVFSNTQIVVSTLSLNYNIFCFTFRLQIPNEAILLHRLKNAFFDKHSPPPKKKSGQSY